MADDHDDDDRSGAVPARSSPEHLMRRYADGDASVFGELYDIVAPRLEQYLVRRTSRKRAQDIVHETMVVVHRERGSYVPGAKVLPWVLAIARRLLDDADAARSGDSRPRMSAIDKVQLEVGLAEIPEAQRSAWELVCLEGLTLRECATILGITPSLARMRAQEAARRLQSLVPELDGAGSSRIDLERAFELRGDALSERYEIAEEIGRGGMGRVYLGEQIGLGRKVALKVLRRELCNDIDHVERFLREARIVAKLRHPNVVEVYDVGELESGQCCYVMEYVEGESLRDRIERDAPLPWAHVKAIASDICAALQAVHRQGVIHRDLKPGNCLLARDDDDTTRVRLVDFGVAKAQVPVLTVGEQPTSPGALLGTPGYIAPEQLRGESADARSDLYAVGVMLYEMLTGRPPFSGRHYIELATQHLLDEPRPIPGITSEVQSIVMRALAKDPDERFESAAELRAWIEALDDHGRARGSLPGPLWRSRDRGKRIVITLAGASAAATFGGLVTAAFVAPPSPTTTQPALSDVDVRAALEKAGDRLRACHERHGSVPDGAIPIQLVVQPWGQVTEAKPKGEHAGTPLGDCLADVVVTTTMPRFVDGNRVFVMDL